jgi:hypothetical protein
MEATKSGAPSRTSNCLCVGGGGAEGMDWRYGHVGMDVVIMKHPMSWL